MADNLTPKEEFLLNPITEHNITDAAIATFETNFRHPVKVEVPFEPVQEGTGNPSPDNVRPINGWTGCEIKDSKDSFYKSTGTSFVNSNTNITSISNDSIRVYRSSGNNAYIVSKQLLNVYNLELGKTYCISADATIVSGTACIAIRNADNAIRRSTDHITSAGNHHLELVFVYDDIIELNYLSFFASYNQTTGGDVTYSNIKFAEVVTIPITFTNSSTGDPLTGYGGKVTLNEDGSEDLIVNLWSKTFTGAEDWTLNSGTQASDGSMRFECKLSPASNWNSTTSVSSKTKSNIFLPEQSGRLYSGYPNKYAIYQHRFYLRVSGIATEADLKSFLSEHNLQVVYPIAPRTYHFPNVGQLKAFLGVNNIWSDIGNVNIKYLTQNSETGMEYRGDRALELRRRAMLADAPTIHTTVGSEATGGLASFKSYIKAPVKKIEIPFAPKQDLHGMDYPYPAGGSVNLIPDTTDTSNGYVAGYYLKDDGTTATGENNYISEYFEIDPAVTYTWSNRTNTSVASSICFYDENKDFISGIAINSQYSQTFTPPEGTVYCRSTQTIYAYQETNPTGAAFQLEVGSTATPYQRYSNICPIDGYDGATLYDEQKNSFFPGLIRFNQLAITDVSKYTRVSTTLSFEDGVFTVSPSTSKNTYKHARRNDVIPGHVYFVSAEGKCNSSSYAGMISFGENSRDYDHATNILFFTANSFIKKQAIHKASTYQTTYAFRFVGAASASVILEVKNFILMDLTDMFGEDFAQSLLDMETAEAGAGLAVVNALLPNEYYEYNAGEITTVSKANGLSANIIPITFTDPSTGDPMTVYGGTVTLNEDGSVDLVREMSIIDLGTRTYNLSLSDDGTYRIGVGAIKQLSSLGSKSTMICSGFKTCPTINASSRSYLENYGISQHATTNDVYICNHDWLNYTTQQLRDALSGIMLCYERATPVTYHFSNVAQLKIFLGENNFWCDISDDITVKYWNRGFGN